MSLDTFTVRDYDTGDGKDIRATVVNPVSPDKDVLVPHHVSEVAPVEDRLQGSGNTTSTSSTAVAGMAPASGKRAYVCAVQCANKGATDVLVTLQDGSGGSAIGYIMAQKGTTTSVVYPAPLKTSANNGLYFQTDAGTTTLYVSAQGYSE